MISDSGCHAACVANTNGAIRVMSLGASKRRAAGLADRTIPLASITSTPSVSVSITSSLTWVCMRATNWLFLANCSSRAKRKVNWLANSATAKKPEPLSPDCRNREADSPVKCSDTHQASASSSSVTLAAVPRASKMGPRMAASNTGSANSGV